jgi:hypothetical protein
MLRAYVMEHQGSWDKNLPWGEFSYNNSHQESLEMAPFVVLYGRRCRTPLNWIEPGESHIWSWHRRWSRSNGTPYSRQPKSREVMPRELCKQKAPALTVWDWRSCVPKGFINEGREEVWGKREVVTSLHRTIPHTREMWNRDIQVGVTTIASRSSRHLPRIVAEEVLEGTCGCGVVRSDTARGRFDIPWAPDQDLGWKESCYKAQDDQVLQYSMEQPYHRRSNVGKQEFSPFSPSKLWVTIVRERATIRCPC